MSKRNIIIFGSLIIIYVLALIVFHATYSYTSYWIEESSIIIPATIIYFIVVFTLYIIFNKKTIVIQNTNIGVKRATKIVAYASASKAVLGIFPYLYYWYFYDIMLFIHPIGWIVISIFFFTLYKNMQ